MQCREDGQVYVKRVRIFVVSMEGQRRGDPRLWGLLLTGRHRPVRLIGGSQPIQGQPDLLYKADRIQGVGLFSWHNVVDTFC